MSPSLNLQSPMRQCPRPPAANALRSSDENPGSFDLRATLAAMAVRELSFAEFRAALEKSAKRLS
jgi:hypothetical protein